MLPSDIILPSDAVNLLQAGDGLLNKVLSKAIQRVIEDMQKRPADKSARTVTLSLCYVPKTSKIENGSNITYELTGATLTPKVRVGLPSQKAPDFDLRLGFNDQLTVNIENPFNHDQPPLFDEDGHGRNSVAGKVVNGEVVG